MSPLKNEDCDVCATSFELNSSNIYRWIPRFQFRSWCNCFQPRNLLYIYRSLFLANKYIGTTVIYLKLSPILSSYFFLKLPLREVCCFKSKSKLCLLSTISLKREKPPINSLIQLILFNQVIRDHITQQPRRSFLHSFMFKMSYFDLDLL